MSNFTVRGVPLFLSNRFESVVGMEFADYMNRNLTIVNADIQNVRTGINLSSLRDIRSSTGPSIGFTTVEDSYLVAAKGVGVWLPASVNGATDLPPQTSVLRNVWFDYPNIDLSGQDLSYVYMHDRSEVTDRIDTQLRNDVWIYDYNGVMGQDLYVVPAYQGPDRCDNSIGECDTEVSTSFGPIVEGHVYPLR